MSQTLSAEGWWEALAGAAEDGEDGEVLGLAHQYAAQATPAQVAALVYALTLAQRDLAVECQRLASMLRHPTQRGGTSSSSDEEDSGTAG